MAFTQLTWKDFLRTFQFVDQAFDSVVNMVTGNDDGSGDSNSDSAILTAGPSNTAVVLKRKRRSDSQHDDGASASKRASSEEDDSDKEDLGAIRFLSSITNVIINPSQLLRKSAYSGDDSWVPSDCEQLAEFPKELLENYKKVHPNVEAPQKYNLVNGDFAVLVSQTSLDEAGTKRKTKMNSREKSESREEALTKNTLNGTTSDKKTSKEEEEKKEKADEKDNPLHHLAITLYDENNSKYVMSLYRSHNFANVVALCERCRENPELFRNFPQDVSIKEYLLTIFNELRENMTWKTVHIAAKIGLIEYFESMKDHKKKRYFNMIAQPEGLSPLMIAVQNDQLETVKLMLDIGADINFVSQNGSNVLHIAALSNAETLKFLWDTKKCATMLNKGDAAGNSPMYVALTYGYLTNARMMKSFGGTLTAVEATHEATPLIGSVKRGKMDDPTLKKILEMKPDAFDEVEPTTGNSVLHCVTTKKCLVLLMEKYKDKVNTGARNNLKQTPLHVFAAKEDLGLVMSICSFSADIDVEDGNGNTPLHYAVTKGNLDMTRQLLCLGANPNKLNHYKETPRHIAARFSEKSKAADMVRSLIICGATTCIVGFVGCAFGCMNREGIGAYRAHLTTDDEKALKTTQVSDEATTGAYEFELDPDTHVVNEAYAERNEVRDFPHKMSLERVKQKLEQLAAKKDKSNVVNVLALDGGGIRGLVTVQMLIALEKFLDKPIIDYFDWIGATSTGCYIMSTLLVGQNIRQAQRYYLQFKDLLFDSWKRPYDANVLESLMKRLFGENLKMADVQYPKIFCTTVRADTFPVQLDLNRNYRLPISDKENDELGFKDPNELTLWKACRRSSAAPTYFSASEGKYIDGGMISNNPTLDLLSEICFWNTTCQKTGKPEKMVDVGCLLSMGTGITPVSPVDPSVFEMNDLMGLLRGIRNLSLVVIDQATATEGAPITRSRSWCHSLGAPYFRLNAPLFKDIILDTNDDLDLAKIMWDSVVYSHTHRKDFEEIANLLKIIGTTEERRKCLV